MDVTISRLCAAHQTHRPVCHSVSSFSSLKAREPEADFRRFWQVSAKKAAVLVPLYEVRKESQPSGVVEQLPGDVPSYSHTGAAGSTRNSQSCAYTPVLQAVHPPRLITFGCFVLSSRQSCCQSFFIYAYCIRVRSCFAGEVALPGGKCEPDDTDDTATALREAEEEIGLPPQAVQILAAMPPLLSKHLLSVRL